MTPTSNFCKERSPSGLVLHVNKVDINEFDARVRRALLEENAGLRQWRRSRLEWRALQALIDATAPATAA
jgi:hypothetical protein